MLHVSETLLEAFQRDRTEYFVQSAVDFLCSELATVYAPVSRSKTVVAVHELVRRAASYGFETEQSLMTFILAAHYLGADFDSAVRSCRIALTDPMRSIRWKADFLEALTLIVQGARERGNI